MTTILATDEFILADRKLRHETELKLSMWSPVRKLYTFDEGRVAVAFAGNYGFKRSASDFKMLYDKIMKVLYADRGSSSYSKLTADTTAFASGVLGGLTFNVVIYTKEATYEYDIKGLTVRHPGGVVQVGSGSIYANAAYVFGVKPERIMEYVATLDEWSSREFDLIYRKDLK